MSDELYTPAWIFDVLGLSFDIDVAAPIGGAAWVPAREHFDKVTDGLMSPWVGRVWMNPPFSNVTPWVDRFVLHRHGIALLPFAKSRHLNKMWDQADGISIPPNGGSFVMANGKLRLPIYFAAFGPECIDAISHIGRVR